MSGCDADKREAIYAFASEIKSATSDLGVEIDFSHLNDEYARTQFSTDWVRFGFDKRLTTVQAYVSANFDKDYARVKELQLGGVIINASLFNKTAPGYTYTTLPDAVRLIKRVRADGKTAHVFSFQTIKDAENRFRIRNSIQWFFSQLGSGSLSQLSSNEGAEASVSPNVSTEQNCAEITEEGNKKIESCAQSGLMQTVSESGDKEYFPVYETNPIGSNAKIYRYGFSKKFPVKRLKTCFDARAGRHYSKVQTERETVSFPTAGSEFWIALNYLECR
jgi:hypothetical protein